MTSHLDPPPGRLANGQFTLGKSRPARRLGHRASHRVVMAILNDFERNRIDVPEHLGRKFPVNCFDTLARLTPQLMGGSGDTCHEDWTDGGPGRLSRAPGAGHRAQSARRPQRTGALIVGRAHERTRRR